jgi:hypothetical protein
MPANDVLSQWQVLSTLLDKLRQGQSDVQAFSTSARAQQDLIGALPARYGTVLHDLLDRLESSALFSEESCSFSRKDLIESLQMWLDKARQQLPG